MLLIDFGAGFLIGAAVVLGIAAVCVVLAIVGWMASGSH